MKWGPKHQRYNLKLNYFQEFRAPHLPRTKILFFIIFDRKIYECAFSALHRAPIGYSNKASYNLLQSIGYALETVGNS